jgi:hypothetical protein
VPGKWLAKKFSSVFTYTVVPDIEKVRFGYLPVNFVIFTPVRLIYKPTIIQPDAYDDAVKLGPDAILHMALPIILSNADATIGPAVSGTLGILNSALKFG